MTPNERAEKIWNQAQMAKVGYLKEPIIPLIAAEIQEAIDDAVEGIMESPGMVQFIKDREKAAAEEAHGNSHNCLGCYRNAKAEAYEDAADEVRSFMNERGLSVELLDLANRIEARAAEVREGK